MKILILILDGIDTYHNFAQLPHRLLVKFQIILSSMVPNGSNILQIAFTSCSLNKALTKPIFHDGRPLKHNVDTLRSSNPSITGVVIRPKKFQFMGKGQNRNFSYEIVISVKNP